MSIAHKLVDAIETKQIALDGSFYDAFVEMLNEGGFDVDALNATILAIMDNHESVDLKWFCQQIVNVCDERGIVMWIVENCHE